jgi:hypothetical protein
MDDKVEQVIAQIFGAPAGWALEDQQGVVLSPGYEDIKAFAALLVTEPPEEHLQSFLEDHPQFLMGMADSGDESNAAFISKPPIGTQYRADFAILRTNQGGAWIQLVELERASTNLFTQKGTPARLLQSAMGQVRDWHQWITLNQQTFVRDTVEMAKRLPQYPDRSENKSFRLRSADSLERSWRAFGGYDNPAISYTIIVGRWANLSEEHRKRLVFLNRHDSNLHKINTYDQITRNAFARPFRRF